MKGCTCTVSWNLWIRITYVDYAEDNQKRTVTTEQRIASVASLVEERKPRLTAAHLLAFQKSDGNVGDDEAHYDLVQAINHTVNCTA